MNSGLNGLARTAYEVDAATNYSSFDDETKAWLAKVDLAGGTLSGLSAGIADAIIRGLKQSTFNDKIVWLLPLLGTNLAAALMPLRDKRARGAPTNTAFVAGDFTEATGLKGNGTSKILNTLYKPSELGTSNAAGIGFWENNISFSGGVEPMGSYSNAGNDRYVLDLRTTVKQFSWGQPANFATLASAATNGHYYGQRASATSRTLYLNGSSIAVSTANDATSGSGDRNMRLMGCDEAGSLAYWNGRCAVAYMTDGTLTPTEVSDLHSLLNTYLIGPTGR